VAKPQRSGRLRLFVSLAATLALLAPLAWFWKASLVPDTYDIAEMGYADYGGGPRTGHDHHHGTGVADLVEEATGAAGVAMKLTVHKDSDRYLVNGTSPGPEIRATQGDLVEVTLVNDNVEAGITLHWHGVDVPNAMDGVAGVTQDAVAPGEEFVYRFVAEQVGTYWYHSHQVSHEQVMRGLLGAFVVEPQVAEPGIRDQVAILHRYSDPTLNGRSGTTTIDAAPGERVRLRVVNTDAGMASAWVSGASYEVLAIDGTDVEQPGEIEGELVGIPAGGRVDLGLLVPPSGVRVDFSGTTALGAGQRPHGRLTG
jgi:FtsP/CotA-like multicopper oxidase with cupredoxin domain